LTSHIRLDGDAIGAELGLLHILKAQGKSPHAVNDSPIPQIYRFLPGIAEIGTSSDDLHTDYDLVVLLDTPTWERIGRIAESLPEDLDVVSIDHHLQVEHIGSAAWVDTSCSSVGEMIYRLARAADWGISAEAATALYTAIVTDTGRFRFPNTSPDALRAAADLIEAGTPHALVCEKVYDEWPPELLGLQSEVFASLSLHAGGRIAVMTLTRDMMARHNVDPIDTQEFADYPRSIRGVRIGVLLREMRDGRVKVSLRARSGVNIEPVARRFGGGGHKEAAGCEIEGELHRVADTVVSALGSCLPYDEEAGI
jgi:phosphoesterase RecJ-like protein